MTMTPESFTALRLRLEKNGGSVDIPGDPVPFPNKSMSACIQSISSALGATPPRPCIRQKTKSAINRTESEFYDILKRRLHPALTRIMPHAIRLQLANGVTYLPDFYTVTTDCKITFFEVKGPKTWEKNLIKLKIAARTYPEFVFYLCQKKNGQWNETQVHP